MYDKIFISYAIEDFQYAEKLFDLLKENGLNPWMDKKNLLPGQKWEFEIQKELRKADFIILLLSQTSVSKRGYVQKEFKQSLSYAEEKLNSDIYIIPIKINACEIPMELSIFQWVDYSSEDGLNKTLEGINIQRNILLRQDQKKRNEISGFGLEEKELKGYYGEKHPRQTYEIIYSVFENKNNNESIREINIIIEREVVKFLMEARDNYYDQLIDDILFHETDGDSSFFGKLNIETVNNNFVSLTWYLSSYDVGAAHPLSWTTGLNYYLNPTRHFSIINSFQDFTGSLTILRDAVHEKLMHKAKHEMDIDDPSDFYYLEEQLEAKPENFSNFYVKGGKLVFVYNPYHLTPYMMGAHHPEISFEELKSLFPGEKKINEFINLNIPLPI